MTSCIASSMPGHSAASSATSTSAALAASSSGGKGAMMWQYSAANTAASRRPQSDVGEGVSACSRCITEASMARWPAPAQPAHQWV